jgi:hypothetical protein
VSKASVKQTMIAVRLPTGFSIGAKKPEFKRRHKGKGGSSHLWSRQHAGDR